MSKRVDELEEQVRDLQDELADAGREVAEVSGANGQLAAKLEDAWAQVVARDTENTRLAGELKAALGVIEAARKAAAWKLRVVR